MPPRTRRTKPSTTTDPGVNQVVWTNPPTKTNYDWVRIAKRLRAKPGKWAKVFDHDRTSVANAIRQGRVRALRPDEGFEVRTTNNERGTPRMCTMYLRWNGD